MFHTQEDNNGNGHLTVEELAERKVFEGATVDLGQLQRQDGIITQAIDRMGQTSRGVIQTYVNAVQDDKNYRQILKNCVWRTREEQRRAVLALAVCDLTGAKNARKIILDQLTAQSAGENGWLQIESYNALNHTTFISQNQQKGKKNGSSKPNSPLSS